jgi:uncharacterized protein
MNWLLGVGRLPYLLLLLVLTLVLGYFAAQLQVEQSNDSMSGRNPEAVRTYGEFRDLFGNDEDLLLSLSHPRLLQGEGLALLAEVSRRLETIDGVRRVFSLVSAFELVSGPDGAEPRPLFPADPADPAAGAQLQRALDANPQLTGLLISADRRTAGLSVELEDRRGDDRYRSELIAQVRALMAEFAQRGEFHLTGIGVQKNDVARYIQRDQAVIVPLSVLLLSLLLLGSFRRLSGVALAMAVTGLSLVWTLGCYQLAGLTLNTITSLLAPVIMVLSVTTSIHLYNGWLYAPPRYGVGGDRVRAGTAHLLLPCCFTALTTALGLLSLLISDIPAVRQFGLFGALGVMLSFLIGATLVPVGLSFLGGERRILPARGTGALRYLLHRIARLTVTRPRPILALALLLALLAACGLPRIHNNTDLLRFLKTSAPLYGDTLFIDEHLAGVNSLEFILSRTDGSPLTSLAALERLDQLQGQALRHPEVAAVYSILDVVQQVHRAEAGLTTLALPANEEQLLAAFDLLEAAPEQALLRKLIDPAFTRARLSVRIHAIGTEAAAPLVAALIREGEQILGPQFRLVPTGSFYGVTLDSNRLVRNQLSSFALSLSLVMGAILLLFRSLRLTLIALIPNLIPIVWVAGLMGWLRIDLSTGTAMIAAVVIGLAVDDTIHYLARFRTEYRGDRARAIVRTTTGTGRAMTISSLVLIVGFWVGCLGSFKPTIYFSLLTGVAMAGALACDLLVLPACLMLMAGKPTGGPR